VILLSAQGQPFTQSVAQELAVTERVVIICGRYEGVDERVAEHLATDEISIGDFVLSGGELPAMLIVDAVTRLLPGSLGNEASSQNESFSAGVDSGGSPAGNISRPEDAKVPTRNDGVSGTQGLMLDFPHYTRPAEYRGWKVPDVLIGGNHAEVAAWRRAAAREKTQRNRHDLRL
jgi:tRNA (guanine37-N1)-methyltransferase